MANLSWVAEKSTGVLIPSGYKADPLYGIVPKNNITSNFNPDGSWLSWKVPYIPNGFDFTPARNSLATRTNAAGLIETMANDVPRLQYPSCPSVLLEPSRTNLALWSQDLTQWTGGTNVVVTADQTISPDGSQNADEINDGTGVTTKWVYRATSALLDATVYSVSGFVKNKDRGFGGISAGAPINSQVLINLSTGDITNQAGLVSNILVEDQGNGWWRISYIVTSTAAGTALMRFNLSDNGINTAYEGTNKSIYAWGAQVEEGPYPTTYIKTEAATANRASDNMSLSGLQTNGILGATDGSMYLHTNVFDNDTTKMISISDGTITNRVVFNFKADGQLGVLMSGGGETKLIDYGAYSANVTYKIAIKYTTNSFSLFVNGAKVGDDTIASSFAYTNLYFKAATGTSNSFYGNVNQFQMYPTALTDAELISLTS